MFLNITKLKKHLKASYRNSGLIAGNADGSLFLAPRSGAWGMQIDETLAPKKLKAAVVELIGELPEDGEAFIYSPEGAQREMNFGQHDFREQWKQAKDCAVQAPFILPAGNTEYALIQIHSTMEVRPVNRELIDLISAKDLDHEVECMPPRPDYLEGFLYWKNETMVYRIMTEKLDESYERLVLPRLAFLDCFKKNITLKGQGDLLPDKEDTEWQSL